MYGLAHILIHKKCAELACVPCFSRQSNIQSSCWFFAQCKNSLTNQRCKNSGWTLRTILSTEYVQNWINRFCLGGSFLLAERKISLHFF